VQPRKPGGFFRDILLGAIAGGAAASEPVPAGSGRLVGLMKGAQAGLQVGPQQQVLRQSAAQEKSKEIQQMNARQLAAATVAHDTVSSFDLGHNLNFHNPVELSKYNSSVNTIKDQAIKAGGQVVIALVGRNDKKCLKLACSKLVPAPSVSRKSPCRECYFLRWPMNWQMSLTALSGCRGAARKTASPSLLNRT